MAVTGLSQVQHLRSSLSLTVIQKRRNMKCKRDSRCPLLRRQMPQWLMKKQMKQSLSTAPPQSRPPSRVQSSRRKMTRTWKTTTVLTPPLQMRMIALAIVRLLLKHIQHKTKCWKQKMKQGACYPHRTGNPQVAAPHRTPLSPLSNEDRGLRLVQGAQSKKLRKSLAPASRQPLGSIPEHEQPPATLADLASRNAQRQEAPVCRNPETPPDHPGATQERSHTMTEIDLAFFPRVRTPCGHGAQVIVEGREEQSDGGEKNKDHKHNPKTTTKGPQAESPPSCSLSSVLVKQVRRKRVSRKGPEFTNEKHIGAGLCSSKAAKRLQRDLTSQL